MTKKRVTGFVITAVFMISMVGTSIAGTATGRTAGGTLGNTTYSFTVSEAHQAYGTAASFGASCGNRVEKLQVTNMIYDRYDGTGGTLSDYVGINVFGYSKTTGISSSSIKSAMARFTITSSNFGKADKIVSK